jgi:hypothetical protein
MACRATRGAAHRWTGAAGWQHNVSLLQQDDPTAICHAEQAGMPQGGASSMSKVSPAVTPEMAAKIKHYLITDMAQHDIAAMFKINQGRVSEIKTGKKFGDVAPMGGA